MSSSPSLTAPPGVTPSPAATARMRQDLTYVELVHRPGRTQRWIRFGAVQDELIVSRAVRFQGFAPGAVFAFVRWSTSDFGTIVSRIDVLQGVKRGSGCTTVPGVIPGAESLLRQSGWPRVERVLKAIDAVEAIGIAPADTAPDHWRHLHHRLLSGQPFRAYAWDRHLAWLARRNLAS